MNAFWLLFLLANGGWAAPAAAGGGHHQHHHLEIGVQGDTPTLVDAALVSKQLRTISTSTTEAAAAASPGLELGVSGTLASSSPRPGSRSSNVSITERITLPESNSGRTTTPEISAPESSTETSSSARSSTEGSLKEGSPERTLPGISSTVGSISLPQSSASTTSTSVGSTSTMSSSTEGSTSKPPPKTSNATKVATTEKTIPKAQTDRPAEQLPAMQLLDLEQTAAPAPPPLDSGHDGLKLTRKKQLQQQHFPAASSSTTTAPRNLETEMERIPSTSTTGTSTTSTKAPHSHHSGYLGPIFMGEKTFSVVHPLKKPQPAGRSHQHATSIESQLRNGQLVEILASTALLRQQAALETSTAAPGVDKGQGQGAAEASSVSTTVFQVPEQLQTSTTRLPTSGERTESKISDIQIEVYDSTVDSIVASTNFRDSEGFYPQPAPPLEVITARPEVAVPPRQELPQERFTQYVIDRADVSTKPASGGGASPNGGLAPPLGQPEPAAIEIHINVSEAFGSESEDLEFSYRQPEKPSKLSDEILVVEIIDSAADNSSREESGGGSSSSLSGSSDPIFTFRNSDAVAAAPPAVRPPQQSSVQDADELFMADLKDLKEGGGSVPRPPPPPPPPPLLLPRKPSIDRDSDTIFYISNTEVKVGESLPTLGPSGGGGGGGDQQRKFQLENQFFPASYVMEPSQRSASVAASAQEEDIILSPHHSSDSLKIYRSDDGAPPLDVTYVGESVIEVEQQPALGWSSGGSSISSTVAPPQQQQQQDIVIQPAVLPDLAIGVPVIGELPPQIELKEIDYMPGELGMGVYENDLQGNSIDGEPDVIESSIQYGGDLIDDGAGGGFDGVEGSYPFESPAHRQQQQQQQGAGSGLSHLPSRHSASHLHREQLPVAEMVNATLLQRLDLGSGYGSGSGSGSGSASAMAPLLASGRSSNATALSEDPLADYDGFFNLFAVSMGLVIVILPSALLVSMYCAIKYVLNKNSTAGAGGAPDDDSEQGQDSAKHESSAASSSSSSSPFSSSSGAAFASASATTTTTTATSTGCPRRHPQPVEPPTAPPGAAHLGSQGRFLDCLQFRFGGEPDGAQSGLGAGGGDVAPSGSVTKMTLKDNHLIVVTEERHDISRNARETKMHTDKDGVFVVEVARGIDSNSTQPADSAVTGLDATELPFDTKMTGNGVHLLDEHSLPPSHEQVQIHAPPQDFAGGHAAAPLHLIEEAEEVAIEEQQAPPAAEIRACTGLSQSDLSSTSSADSNKRYSYGNQELYVIEQPGYATRSPTAQPILASPKPEQEQELELEQPPSTGPEQEENLPEPAEANPEIPPEKESPELPEKSLDLPENADTQPQLREETDEPPKEAQEKAQPEPESESPPEVDIEPEANYDSLMSLPAPPSTDEINSELGDYSLLESNQLDSLPPPPPPLAPSQEQLTTKSVAEEEKPLIGNGNASELGKVKAEEPATLTPPASPPASPPPPQSGIYGNGNGLSNGMHSMVDVNGS